MCFGLDLLEELFGLAQNSPNYWIFFHSALDRTQEKDIIILGLNKVIWSEWWTVTPSSKKGYLFFRVVWSVLGKNLANHLLQGGQQDHRRQIPRFRDKLFSNQVFLYSELWKHFQRYYSRQVSSNSAFPDLSKWLLKYLLFVESSFQDEVIKRNLSIWDFFFHE